MMKNTNYEQSYNERKKLNEQQQEEKIATTVAMAATPA